MSNHMCSKCGAESKYKAGEKNGKKWAGYFCTADKSHVDWVNAEVSSQFQRPIPQEAKEPPKPKKSDDMTKEEWAAKNRGIAAQNSNAHGVEIVRLWIENCATEQDKRIGAESLTQMACLQADMFDERIEKQKKKVDIQSKLEDAQLQETSPY